MADKLSPEAKELLNEGHEWAPFVEDGTKHGADHVVCTPAIIPEQDFANVLESFMAAARREGKIGTILRVLMPDGSTLRLMVTQE